jgi:hypothetical protein
MIVVIKMARVKRGRTEWWWQPAGNAGGNGFAARGKAI